MFVNPAVPIGGVVFDVLTNVFQRPFITNDVFVISRLPLEIGKMTTDFDGTNPFVLIDDYPQTSRRPMVDFLVDVILHGRGFRRDAQFGRLYRCHRHHRRIECRIRRDFNNPMHMIRHDDKFVQRNKRKMFRNRQPTIMRNLPD